MMNEDEPWQWITHNPSSQVTEARITSCHLRNIKLIKCCTWHFFMSHPINMCFPCHSWLFFNILLSHVKVPGFYLYHLRSIAYTKVFFILPRKFVPLMTQRSFEFIASRTIKQSRYTNFSFHSQRFFSYEAKRI